MRTKYFAWLSFIVRNWRTRLACVFFYAFDKRSIVIFSRAKFNGQWATTGIRNKGEMCNGNLENSSASPLAHKNLPVINHGYFQNILVFEQRMYIVSVVKRSNFSIVFVCHKQKQMTIIGVNNYFFWSNNVSELTQIHLLKMDSFV